MSIGRWSPFGIVFAGGLAVTLATARPADCGCDIDQAPSPGPTVDVVVHDPSMAKEGKRYVLFATGVGVPMRFSDDGKRWTGDLRVFEKPPEWAPRTIAGFQDHIWAPDVSRFGGRWHLYYTVSTFGKNRSAIGHATNLTLDPADRRYRWTDEGPVVQSYPTDDFNAIDPNVVLDASGTPWLSFGSFWNGLRVVRLDGKGRLAKGARPVAIAARPHEGPQQPGAIEAPFIVRHRDLFYLFASYDFCCRGVNSTYNVRVGRAKRVEGPYLDREGRAMTEGGGTEILRGGVRWKGPGGESVLHDGKDDVLVYHAYDAEDRGTPKLRTSKIDWGRDGWPSVAAPE